ncbi:hypothetical protein XPA_000950 [Xanthoria parietina]
MWAAGDDLSRTIQIRALQDVPAFVAFTDKGQYINNPPFDPKELKNDLAVILQTFVVTHSLAQKSCNTKQLYWSPLSRRYHRIRHGGSADGSTGTTLEKIREANWADLPLLFDGAYPIAHGWTKEKTLRPSM